jgi:hypothetical protein
MFIWTVFALMIVVAHGGNHDRQKISEKNSGSSQVVSKIISFAAYLKII